MRNDAYTCAFCDRVDNPQYILKHNTNHINIINDNIY